jgi:hypothetical protein
MRSHESCPRCAYESAIVARAREKEQFQSSIWGATVEIEELLSRAWGAVENAGIPEPLQEYAFKEALARLTAQNGTPDGARPPEPSAGKSGTSTDDDPGGPVATKSDDELFAKFAHESGIAVADLERVFYFNGGEPHLNGPRAKLGRTTADQAKAVAVAITAAYDYALDRRPIEDQIVRTEAARLKCDLGGNWAKQMVKATGVSWVGASRQKQFKTKSDTQDTLKKIVAAALGQPDE